MDGSSERAHGSGECLDSVKRQSQVNEQTERIDKSIQVIQASLENLENRLGAILVPMSNTGTGDVSKEPRELVGLAIYLRLRVLELEKIADRIENITQRIEL